MAALSGNAATPPRHNPGTPQFEGTYKATGADEYYIGAVVCHASGKAILTNLDAAYTLGFCMRRVTAAAADDPVRVHVKGVWWVACAQFADGDLWVIYSPGAGSDNPADITEEAATGQPGALGTLIHVDVTGTSGWLDLDQREVPTNA